MQEIYFAGGCFWGIEHFFQQIQGVTFTQTGFANGSSELPAPTYEQVYTDTTGYAETVLVRFDESLVDLPFLVRMFFAAIDPLSLNKQGHDEGTRYRTGVYYVSEEQRPLIESVFAEEQKKYDSPMLVELLPLIHFYPADEYHQSYLIKHPDGYCHLPLQLFLWAKQQKKANYTHRYSLTAADMDTRYRMTPNAVLLYYQDCWARYMSCLHLAAFDVVKQNRIWVITEFNAWFEEQTALWSDDIDVTVWNSEVSALRLYAEFRVRRSDGVEVAHGYGCWTLLDTEAHRLAPMTPFQPQIPVLPEMTSETHKKRRFPTDGTPLQQIEHRVNPINLDFNGHVNNRTYLSIAMQSADEAFMDAHAIRCLTIHWLKETFLGDTLICRLTLLPNETEGTLYHYLHSIARNDSEIAAQIYSEWVPRKEQIDVSVHAQRK